MNVKVSSSAIKKIGCPPEEIFKLDEKWRRVVPLLLANGSTGEKVGEEGLVCTGEGSSSKDHRANSAHSSIVGDMDVMASRILLDGHFWNYGDTYSGADHAYETTELATFKNNLGVKVGAIACGDGGFTKAVAVAEQKEWLGAEMFQGNRAALSEFVVPRKGGEEALSEQRGGFEFVAPDRKSKDGDVDRAGTKPVEKDRRNLFCDTEKGLRKFA